MDTDQDNTVGVLGKEVDKGVVGAEVGMEGDREGEGEGEGEEEDREGGMEGVVEEEEDKGRHRVEGRERDKDTQQFWVEVVSYIHQDSLQVV